MKKTENEFHSAFYNAGVGLSILENSGSITLVNKKLENLSGYSKDELENKKNLADIFSSNCQEIIKSFLNSITIKEQSLDNIPCIVKKGNGKFINVLLSVFQMPGDEKLVASITDVTAYKKFQRNFYLSAHQKNIAKLSSGIAHEIRNPLSAITTSIEILKDSLTVSGQDKKLMEIILEENKRLSNLITEFTRFARLENPDFQMVALNELIEMTIELIRSPQGADISIELNFDETIPIIQGDKKQLELVIKNILTNAVEAMPGGGKITISTTLYHNEYNESQIKASFSDTGIGIDEIDIKKVFRPFYSNKEKTSGMGLAICERIIEAHFGEILIESEKDKGTIVSIVLPTEIPSTTNS